MKGLLVLETPWDHGLRSDLSVGPFLMGLRDALHLEVVTQRFNGKDDLVHYLGEFVREPGLSHCYIGAHGTAGRIQALLGDVNAATIGNACRGSRDKGFIISACSFGNEATARRFLQTTRAHFVAGYAHDVPWMESMLVDLMFMTYLFGGRCRRVNGESRSELLRDRRGDFCYSGTADPVKAARWVVEDLPLATMLRFSVHSRRK